MRVTKAAFALAISVQLAGMGATMEAGVGSGGEADGRVLRSQAASSQAKTATSTIFRNCLGKPGKNAMSFLLSGNRFRLSLARSC